MADRTVSVSLRANVASFMASMRAASKSAEDFATRNRAEMETVGRGLLGMGTAAVAGLGLATKAAIDWESAWAGVTKTVDGSEQQLAALEGELREMAKSLPASHEEIAAVAEAAGQLGVKVDDVSEFTRVMIDLGETTNLSAEEAATGLARFSNIMGTAQEDVDRLGSTIVDLGNNSETTEAEILELSTRLAAAGNIAGLSESDVLAFGATLTSVGVRAEAGGTALSKTFTTIRDAVLDGGDALDTFAEVSGTSADEFASHFREDPADAIATFIAGLGEMNAAGQSTTGVFEDLELTDQRLMRALLSTASAGDLLTDSLERGERAWEENTALTKEAQRRYETASAQISMAWNSIKDAAIEVGSVVAPIVADLAGFIGDLADAFGELPDGVDIAVAAVLGLGGAMSLAGGAALLLLPRIAETKAAMQALGLTTGKTGKAMRGFGMAAKGLGIAAIAFGIAAGLRAIADEANKAEVGVGEMTNALADLRRGEASEAIDKMISRVEGMADRSLFETVVRNFDAVRGATSLLGSDSEKLASELEVVDDALAGMVQGGNADLAEESFRRLAQEWEAAGGNADDLIERFPEYQDALEGADAEQKNAADSADEYGGAMDDAASSTDEATEALQTYMDELRAMTDPVFAVFNALDAVEQAQADYNEAVKEHGENSDEAREASIRQMRALEDLEQAALNGDLSFEDFSARLDTWVERGDLAAEQAAEIRDRVKEARGEAEDFQGEYKAEMALEARAAEQKIARLLKGMDDLDGKSVSARVTISSNMTSGQVGNLLGGRHQGGPIMHDGGPVTRMHSGGPRHDERDVRLKVGEFVVQAPAVQQLGPDAMKAINQGMLPGQAAGGHLTIENHIEIGGEVVRVVRSEISEDKRTLKRGVRQGTGRAR